jgi:hypothetical protein
MAVAGASAPIDSFALRAHVTARQGVQSNDFEATYQFLAPNLIRFGIGQNRETGRGPGKGQEAYWLRDGDALTWLAGREYIADRELVARMTTIAGNLIALSDLGKVRTERMELRERAPAILPQALAWKAKQLVWIEFLSPDFDLYRAEPPAGADAGAPRLFRVLLGAHKKSLRPELVLLREEGEPGTIVGEPLLFELLAFQEVDGYLLPHGITVRSVDSASPSLAFEEKPGQEISVLFADLTPGLTPEAFEPRAAEKPR